LTQDSGAVTAPQRARGERAHQQGQQQHQQPTQQEERRNKKTTTKKAVVPVSHGWLGSFTSPSLVLFLPWSVVSFAPVFTHLGPCPLSFSRRLKVFLRATDTFLCFVLFFLSPIPSFPAAIGLCVVLFCVYMLACACHGNQPPPRLRLSSPLMPAPFSHSSPAPPAPCPSPTTCGNRQSKSRPRR
jgi:hypothetical protein